MLFCPCCSTDVVWSGGRSGCSVGQYSVLLEDFEKTALPALEPNTEKVEYCGTSAVDQYGL